MVFVFLYIFKLKLKAPFNVQAQSKTDQSNQTTTSFLQYANQQKPTFNVPHYKP